MNASKVDLRTLVTERRILVCTGSGGVGKTTVAAVLAMEAAAAGRKAVVVTIDPAKRLADALGLEDLQNTPSEIDGGWPGEMWAMMLDPKSTFDSLVTKYAGDAEQAERILANPFYRNISGALSGTQEYMAMEKLYELHEETDFDLVVVDTPPTRNALDFLEAPQRLSNFLDHRLYRVLMAPTRGVLRAVNLAAQAFLRTVSKVVGGDVIEDAIAFFTAFEGMEEGFRERAVRVGELLEAEATAFVLVASPRRDTVEEAAFFAEKLIESDLDIEALIVNRMHPRWGDELAEATRARADSLAGTDLGGLYSNLADFQLIASREEQNLEGLTASVGDAAVVRVPMLRTDVHDLKGLAGLGELMFGDSA